MKKNIPKRLFLVHNTFCLQILQGQRMEDCHTKLSNARRFWNSLKIQNPLIWCSYWDQAADFQLWDHGEPHYESGSNLWLPQFAKTFFWLRILTFFHDKQCILKNTKIKTCWIYFLFYVVISNICVLLPYLPTFWRSFNIQLSECNVFFFKLEYLIF